MGHKVNPIGFRVGLSRKWSFSWFNPSTVQKSTDSALAKNTLLTKGVVTSRGGFFLSSFENRFRGFFKRYIYLTFNKTRQFLPIDVQCRKGAHQHLFVFLIYVKLRGRTPKKKKRKKLIKIKKFSRKKKSQRNKKNIRNFLWKGKKKFNF